MAEREQEAEDLIRNIRDGISNLSNALAAWGPPRARPNGARAPARAPGPSTSTSTSMTTTNIVQPVAVPPSTVSNTNNNMRREFQSLFGLGRGRGATTPGTSLPRGRCSRGGAVAAGRGRGRGGRTSGVFYKDVILLDYGAESSLSKLQAVSIGRASCMLPLHKQMNEAEIEELVESAFESQLKDLQKPRFEYVKVIHNRVVVPHTRSGQMWDGTAIRSLCGQGDLYVRATASLPVAEEEGTEDEDEPDPVIVPTRDPATTPRRRNAREIRTPVHRHDASDALINILVEQHDEKVEEESSIDEESNINLRDELRRLSSFVSNEKTNLISVFRGSVLAGAIRAMKRPTFDPRASMDVIFSSGKSREGAIDLGGPRKEFLRLCVREVLRQPIFEGPANELQLALNQHALDNYMYKHCGALIAISLVHGGPGPRCLSAATYRRLTMSCTDDVSVQSIGDADVRSKISKVLDASSADAFDAAIEDPVVDTIMTLNGLHGPFNMFSNKLEVGRSLIKAILGNRLEPCFSQFREGLSTLGVLASMQAYPNVWFDPFCVMQAPRSVRELLSLFQCQLAPEGSNKAAAQARTLAWWGDFAADCEAGVTDHGISVGDILTFITCLPDEPAGGFDPTPSIAFTEGKYPEANTCSNVLRLPVCHVTYDEFAKNMIEGIIGGQGFGQS